MSIRVLLNPFANRWNARKRWPEAERALRAAGVDFQLAVSQKPGEPEELAGRALEDGCETIVIAGGDGTIGEVLNGLSRHWTPNKPFPFTLGILPLGSANDFAFAIGLPTSLAEAASVIAAGHTKPVDLCQCNDRHFLNNSGAALEPYVTVKQERIPWIQGVPRYLVAAVWAIMDKPEWHGRIEWDGGQYEGPLSLISVGNGRRTGGFFMTPHADPFDGKLTMAFGYRPTRRDLFAALPRAFKEGAGNYIELPGMREVHCTRAKIVLKEPSPAHTDGVLFDQWQTELSYSIFPGAIPVLVPAHA